MLLATILPPLLALNPRPSAVTGPFAVTSEFVLELIPVPKPVAVTEPFAVTLALLIAVMAVPLTVTPPTVQGAPPF